MLLSSRSIVNKAISTVNNNTKIFKNSFQRITSLQNSLLIKDSEDILDKNKKMSFTFSQTFIPLKNYTTTKFYKIIRKFKSDQINKTTVSEENRAAESNTKEDFFQKKRRKRILNKTFKKKDFTVQCNNIINIFSMSPVLLTQSAVGGNKEDEARNVESFIQEKTLYDEIIALLKEGKLNDAAKRISAIIELIVSNNSKSNSCTANHPQDQIEAQKSISFRSANNSNKNDNHTTRLKKMSIYKIALGDIYSILGKTLESEFHFKNVIYLMEINPEFSTNQDKFMLIKLKERLCSSYLSRDEYDFIEEKLNQECEKLIESNIFFLEEKAALPQIENQQHIFLNVQKMLMENLHFLASALRKEKKFKEANECLFKYLKRKERFPVLSQHLINVEYSVHLNLALNFLSLSDIENSVNFFNLALDYLSDESQENFIEAKIMITDKLCDIYEEQADMSKLMDFLEEKKRLTIALINLKTNSVKEFIEKNQSKTASSELKHLKNNLDNSSENQNENQNSEKEKEKDLLKSKKENEDVEVNSINSPEAEEAAVLEKEDFSFRSDPLFLDFEDFTLKKDYLSLAKVYEELIELILENELQPEKFEEYLCEAEKYYNMLQKEEVFATNLNFILFIKNFDDAKNEAALHYGLKILKAIESFEAKISFILNPEYYEALKDHEIQFLQITERFYYLEAKEQKAFLLNKFTNFDFYSFETKFKFYFYLSKIHKALNNQEQKSKFQNWALKEYDDFIKENKDDDQKKISVFHLIDLMSIYENRQMAEKLYEVFDMVIKEIKAGEFEFLKKDDKELYAKTLYDFFFMKINYLIFEQKFLEAKEALRALDKCALDDEDLKFSEEQRDNINKTLNLLDLKLKYIK